MVAGPLTGTTVVDLTRFVSGPFATMVLASLGARVLKIEVPPLGDSYRSQGLTSTDGTSTLFESVNRGKESVALDFREPDGADALELLLAGSDFLVHNARPGSMERYGLDFDSVHQRHPWLIHGSISAFGDLGPQAGRGGFDLIVQAESGLMSVTGSEASGPVKVGAPMLDIGAGLAAVTALLAAHVTRLTTEIGSEISSSLLEFAMASFTTLAGDVLLSGTSPTLLGSHSSSFAPYGGFSTRSGNIVIAGAGDERLWLALCGVLGRAELATDPRFIDNLSRVKHRDKLTDIINSVLGSEDLETWLERFEAAGIPAGQVQPLHNVLVSPQVQALNIIRTPTDNADATAAAVDPPFRINGERPRLVASPQLGAHTRSVLREFGASLESLERLTP